VNISTVLFGDFGLYYNSISEIKDVAGMTEKKLGREVAFVETYNESTKKIIEKAFLKQGVSYLIKVDKVREMKKGHFECRMKYSFYINRLQTEEAQNAMALQDLDENSINYLM
jgi:hypothetical protein